MSTQAIATVTRALPATLARDTTEAGYRILSALDRLGFVHTTHSGETFTVRFRDVTLYGALYAVFEVDTERLYHYSIADLSTPKVIAQLQAVTKKPVKVLRRNGFYFVIDLHATQRARLPDSVTLDLAEGRPEGALLVPLGVGRDGAVWRSLPELGHTLIVGTTGAGKSTLIHSALAALLTSCGPDRLRLVLIDPKRSEFTAWADVPHLIGDIANTEEQATALLSDLAQEVGRRGDLFGAALCRDLAAYNRKAADPLPYILIAIDECLDLVLSAGSKSNLAGYLKTIAIRGRSAGVILWAATQHASAVDGLPRVVNVNLSARLVFRVADDNAARSAGCPGSESIPRDRPGRLLAKIDGKPQELQGYHLPDADLLKVARAIAGSKPSGPTLSETEAALIAWALADNDGYLSLLDIQRQAQLGPKAARRLAGQWERRGWLAKDVSNGNTRRVTDNLKGRVSS